jgi:glycosyltransferase involved in cell wall biosynthesis
VGKVKKILLVGSNSIHCKRYFSGVISSNTYNVAIITNQLMDEFVGLAQWALNFGLQNLKASKQIRHIITEFNPDIIHIHQANSYAWGSDVLVLPNQSKLMHKMVCYNLRNVDIITSDSLFMSSKISQLISPSTKKIHTINFGIQSLPNKQDLANKQNLILSNRLHKPLYRVDMIVRAFASLCSNNLIDSDYKLVVAAGGDESNKIIQLSKELNIFQRIVFTGMLPYSELVEYYKLAKIFVSVPISDGAASSLLESMAYGCIPVLSNLPANLEWVLDEINGFIAPDIDNLAQQILSAIQLSCGDYYSTLYDFNYELIAHKAVFKTNINKFLKLYN